MISEPHAKRLLTYVREVADKMRLADWSFEVSMQTPAESDSDDDGEARAQVQRIPGRRLAILYFRDDVVEISPEELRTTVVHELIHCHLALADEVMDTEVKRALSRDAHDAIGCAYYRGMEFGVDALSEALGSHMPLIAKGWADAPSKARAGKRSTDGS